MSYVYYVGILGLIDRTFDLYTGGKRRPVFFDIDRTRPELRALDRDYAAIRAELLTLLQEKTAIPRYHDLDDTQQYISGSIDT